jgi:hypothetical protein
MRFKRKVIPIPRKKDGKITKNTGKIIIPNIKFGRRYPSGKGSGGFKRMFIPARTNERMRKRLIYTKTGKSSSEEEKGSRLEVLAVEINWKIINMDRNM